MDDTTFFLPYLGRWDQFRKSRFHQIAERLVGNGHTVHVIQAPVTESDEVTFSRRDIEPPDGIILHDANLRDSVWNAPGTTKVIQKGYYGIGVRKQVRQLIANNNIDVLWLYNLPHYLLAKIDSVPIIFDVVDDYVAMLNSELPGDTLGPTEPLVRWTFARLLERCDLITVISHELQDQIYEMVGKSPPAVIVPNGVDTDLFNREQNEDQALQNPPVIGFVGSFEYFIDFDLILDAAAKMPDVQFLLVGDGREFEHVQRQCRERNLDNVKLPGLVESDEVPAYIREMDVCLNTFKRIPLAHSAVPLKLFEYLSQGRPIISTRIHEVERIDDGYFYYADTTEELVDTINSILRNYPKAVSQTHRGYSLIEETYNWDSITDSFETAIHKHL